MSKNYLRASRNPVNDIDMVSYEGQLPGLRMYKSGYEKFFEALPELQDDDPFLDVKLTSTKTVMHLLATNLQIDPWLPKLQPLTGGFNRTILALESPIVQIDGTIKEGKEIVIARWGDGKSSPVHGHGDGLLFEQLLFGKMRVNIYRIIDHKNRIARPVETKIYSNFENIAAQYTPKQDHVRSALVHNFTSIGYSASLHFVPEHTRDGRDNRFDVEYFDRGYFLQSDHFKQLTAQEGLEQLRIGDVALVRSENVPDYGDHFIVITGKPILKEHGLRPQDIAIHAPYAARILNQYDPIMGLTLLKLTDEAALQFRIFHDIQIKNGEVVFPNA